MVKDNEFDTSAFDNMTRECYEQYIRAKRRSGESFTEADPVAFFDVSDDSVACRVKLDIPRAGQYLLCSM